MSRLHSYDEADVSFYYIDENAKRARPNEVDTFDKLIAYLNRPILNTRHSQLYLVRGILVWIAHNQSYSGPDARYNTPIWFTQQLVRRRISPAEVFKTFCGYAGIECEEISGRAKAIRYRAGDGDLDYFRNHTWTAFKADDKWHVMHPQWSIHAYVGYEHGGEIQIEKDGKDTIRVKVQKQGKSMFMVNDYWFCTAPEIFVTRCFPDDTKWQNPKGNILIKNVSDFLSLPDLRQGFYDMKLSLLSEKACILNSENGKCYISIMTEKDFARAVEFSYELAMEGTSGDGFKVKEMKQLVLYQVCGKDRNSFKFEIRLPVVGTYWFRLAVGSADEPDKKRNCCEFKIICKEACKNCQRFPTCAGLGFYGYGSQAEDAGLLSSSETNAKINIKPNTGKSKTVKQTVAKFKTDCHDPDRNMKYNAEMYVSGSDSIDGDDLDVQIKGTTEVVHDKTNDQLIVNVNVPKDGEYAVVITAQDQRDKTAKKAKPVAGYLVTTKVDEDDRKNNAQMKKREKEVRCEINMKSKLEKRNILAEILDATRAEVNALQVSGKIN